MLINKKKHISLQEEIAELKKQLETVKAEKQQIEDSQKEFIDSFAQELSLTIEQHELVNSQHHAMGNLVEKIKDHFDKVDVLSHSSYENSGVLSKMGGELN